MNKTLDWKIAKTAVKKSGLKQTWIAEQIGVSENTLSSFLSGKQNLGKPAQILLARVLKLDEASEKAS